MRERFELIPLAELSVLEIACPKCGTILALKMDGEGFFPEQCPACRELPRGLSGKLNKALTAYRDFYREINGLGLEPRFRMKLKES
jgi:phage FluMu protein Com